MSQVLKAEIFSPISEYPVERRFDVNLTIQKLKEKLEPITGANHQTMEVSLSFTNNEQIALVDSNKTIAEYLSSKGVHEPNQVKLHVKDDQAKELFSGDVPKYELSEDKYAQRKDSARNFIREVKKKNAITTEEQ